MEVAHEAVFHPRGGWKRLRGWLDENRKSREALSRAQLALDKWEANNFHSDYLIRGRELEQMETELDGLPSYSADIRQYVSACRFQEGAKKVRWRKAMAIVSILVAVPTGFWISKSWQYAVLVPKVSEAKEELQTTKSAFDETYTRYQIAKEDLRTAGEELTSTTESLNSVQIEFDLVKEELAKTGAMILAAKSLQERINNRPQLSLLLAVDAVKSGPRAHQAEQNLREALARIGGQPLASKVSIDDFAASPDGRTLAYSSGHSIFVMRRDSKESREFGHELVVDGIATPVRISIDPSGEEVFAATRDGLRIFKMSPDGWNELDSPPDSVLSALVFVPQKNCLACAARNKIALRSRDGRVIASANSPLEVSQLEIVEHQNQLHVFAATKQGVFVFQVRDEAAGLQLVQIGEIAANCDILAYCKATQCLVTQNHAVASVSAWKVFAPTPDGPTITGQHLAMLPLVSPVRSMVVSNEWLLLGCADNVIRCFDLKKLERKTPTTTLHGHDAPIRTLALSGGELFSLDEQNSFRSWPAPHVGRTAQPRLVTAGLAQDAAAASRGGQVPYILTSGEDTVSPKYPYKHHAARYLHAEPDRSITTADRTIRLTNAWLGIDTPSWDWSLVCNNDASRFFFTVDKDIRESGGATVIGSHPTAIADLSISSDGRQLLSYDKGGTAKLWHLEPAKVRYRKKFKLKTGNRSDRHCATDFDLVALWPGTGSISIRVYDVNVPETPKLSIQLPARTIVNDLLFVEKDNRTALAVALQGNGTEAVEIWSLSADESQRVARFPVERAQIESLDSDGIDLVACLKVGGFWELRSWSLDAAGLVKQAQRALRRPYTAQEWRKHFPKQQHDLLRPFASSPQSSER